MGMDEASFKCLQSQTHGRVGAARQARPRALLGRIIGVDSDVFGSEVGGQKFDRGLPRSEADRYAALWVCEFLMRSLLVECAGGTAAADDLVANQNTDLAGIDFDPASSHGGENSAPVGVGACPGGFH